MTEWNLVTNAFVNNNASTLNSDTEINNNFNFHPNLEKAFLKIFDSVKDFDNTIMYGARGVGKTLFLKKIKQYYLNKKNGVLPLFIDLSDLRIILHHYKNENLQYKLITYHFNFSILREFF